MYLVQIFRHSPIMGLAIIMCLATIFWCTLLAHRHRNGIDRFLTGLLGFIAVYQALRILKDTGLVILPGIHHLDSSVDFIISGMCLISALILKLSSIDRATTKVRLRLVEANEKPLEVTRSAPSSAVDVANAAIDASPLAMFAVDVNGSVNYWNNAAEKVFGWKKDEVLGHRPPFAWNASGNPFIRFRNKYGEEFEAVIWTAPIRHSSGSTRGTLTVVADHDALQEAGLMPSLVGAK